MNNLEFGVCKCYWCGWEKHSCWENDLKRYGNWNLHTQIDMVQ